MVNSIANIYRLGVKELYGVRYDVVLLWLIAYAFTVSVYLPAKSARVELVNARSRLLTKTSRTCRGGSSPPCAGRSFSPPDGFRLRRSTRRRTPASTRLSSTFPPNFRQTWRGVGVPPFSSSWTPPR